MTAGRVRAAVGPGAGPDALTAVDAALATVAEGLAGAPDIAVLFLGSGHASAAGPVAQRVRDRLHPRHLLGVTASAVVAGAHELEDPASLSVWAANVPGATVTPLRYPPAAAHDEPAAAWPEPPEDTTAVVLFADPFTFPADAFLAWWDQARPGVPVSGGMASGAVRPADVRLVLDGDVVTGGAVGLALGGVAVRTLVSQGCRPVGDSYTVTRAERNLVQELAGEAPVERIRATFSQADAADQELMRSGLHVGTVIDEYRERHNRGDFLVRGVLGAEPRTGAIAVGDVVRVGQTLRFHVRDAASAEEDLRELLAGFTGPAGEAPAAALLFTCNGRGQRLFGTADHDARMVSEALGGAPLAGLHCAGELGPVGERSFLHGFTASVLVIDDAPHDDPHRDVTARKHPADRGETRPGHARSVR